MKELFESVAAKAAGGLQNAGSKFDFEVFALPGGSVIAVVLWCWSMALMMVKSSHEHRLQKHSTLEAPTAEITGRNCIPTQSLTEPGGSPEMLVAHAASRVSCTWRGAHCV